MAKVTQLEYLRCVYNPIVPRRLCANCQLMTTCVVCTRSGNMSAFRPFLVPFLLRANSSLEKGGEKERKNAPAAKYGKRVKKCPRSN